MSPEEQSEFDEEYLKQLQQWTRDKIAELDTKELSNSALYDQSLLTLSASFLGGSLAFLDKVVGTAPSHSHLEPFVYFPFLCCVGLVIFSFIVGQFTISRQKELYEEFRNNNFKDSSVLDKNWLIPLNNGVNIASGGAFLLGVAALTVFIFVNLRPAIP